MRLNNTGREKTYQCLEKAGLTNSTEAVIMAAQEQALLVPKSDQNHHFCTDYLKLNAITKPDSFPLSWREYCNFVTKLDLFNSNQFEVLYRNPGSDSQKAAGARKNIPLTGKNHERRGEQRGAEESRGEQRGAEGRRGERQL